MVALVPIIRKISIFLFQSEQSNYKIEHYFFKNRTTNYRTN